MNFRWIGCVILLIAVGVAPAEDWREHHRRGEYAAARRLAESLGAADRDSALASIARAQSRLGQTSAASETARGIESPRVRGRAMVSPLLGGSDGVDPPAVGGTSFSLGSGRSSGSGSSGPSAPGGNGFGSTGGSGAPIGVGGAAGGGAMADFQSLMNLIETTVVPDTWEALGGPSTMAPYPQGVFVDPSGMLHEIEGRPADDARSGLTAMLATPGAVGDEVAWHHSTPLRCVSLRRLLDQVTSHRIAGIDPTAELDYLAGLSNVRYVFFDRDDVVFAGPVGGLQMRDGFLVDMQSATAPLRIDFLAAAFSSALHDTPIGCTIDPTTEGLRRAASIAKAVSDDEIPIGRADDAMAEAFGVQNIEVFGIAADTPIGVLMVHADRHMKQLALGVREMPEGVGNYLDAIDRHIDAGVPDDLLLRLWFAPRAMAIRGDEAGGVYELAGRPIRLSGENERAVADGSRGHLTTDVRSEAFVTEFNTHFDAIRDRYPVYAALESIYHAAAIAELIDRRGDDVHRRLAETFIAAVGEPIATMPAPRTVESIAVLHTARRGSKRHHVVVASGGVAVDPSLTLAGKVRAYPTLASAPRPGDDTPPVIQRWWWNAK